MRIKLTFIKDRFIQYFHSLKKHKKKILKGVLVFFTALLFISNSGYAYSTENSTIFVALLGLGTVISFGILFLFFPFKDLIKWLKIKAAKKKHKIKIVVFGIIPVTFMLVILMSFVFNFSNNELLTIIHYLLIVVFSFSFCVLVSFETFKKYFIIVAEIVCVYSLILYVLDLSSVVGVYTSRFTNVVNHSFNNFLFIHFSLINDVSRNCGPFWEPGLFATYTIVAIIFELITKKEKCNYFALIIFSITIFTTLSTAGILLWFLLIPVFFFEKKKKKTAIIVFIIFVSIFAILVSLSLIGAFDNIPVLSKLLSKLSLKNASKSGSFGTRLASISLDLKIFAKSPIFGVGPNNFDRLYFELGKGAIDAQTSTVFWLAGSFGIVGFLMTILPFASIILTNKIKSSFSGLIISLIYLVCLLKEPHYAFILTWLINFYLMKDLFAEKHYALVDSRSNNSIASKLFGKKGNQSILLRNASGTAVIKIASMAIGLIATPVYLAFFANPITITSSGEITTIGKMTFGIWSTILSILVWILHFDMGVGNGLKNKVVEALAKNDKDKVKQLITSAYIGNAILSSLIMLVGLVVVNLIDVNSIFGNDSMILSTSTLKIVLSLVVVSISVELFLKLSLNLFQSIQKQTIASVIPLVSTVLLITLCIIFRFDGPDECMIGISIFYLLAINVPLIVATIVIFAKPFKGCFSFKTFTFKTMKEVMKLGGLFFLIQLFILVYNSSDQILISNLWGANFSVDYKYYYEFYFAVAALCSAISLPIWSIATKAVSENKFEWAKKLQKKMWLLWLVFIFGDLLIFASLQFIFNIWLGSNSIAVNYIYSMLFASWSIFTCLSYLVTGFGNGLKALKTQLIVMGLGAAIKIPAVILLHKYTNLGWISVLIPSTLTILIVCIIQPIENSRALAKKQKEFEEKQLKIDNTLKE